MWASLLIEELSNLRVLLICRGGEKEGHFIMKKLDPHPKQPMEENAAFRLEFEWSQDGKSVRTTDLYFKPPCLTA